MFFDFKFAVRSLAIILGRSSIWEDRSKVQWYIAFLSAGRPKPEVFRIVEEAEGDEGESERLGDSRSGNRERGSAVMHTRKKCKKKGGFDCLTWCEWKAVLLSIILAGNRSLGKLKSKLEWLEQEEHAVKSKAGRTHWLHLERSSVHERIVHGEGIIKKLQE